MNSKEPIQQTVRRLIAERINEGQSAPFVWLVTELVNRLGYTKAEAEEAVMTEFDRSDPEELTARARELQEHAAELKRYVEMRKAREKATAS